MRPFMTLEVVCVNLTLNNGVHDSLASSAS